MQDQLLQPVYGPKDDLNSLRVASSGLRNHFDDVLEVSRAFLGKGLEFFPMNLDCTEETVFMITTPKSFMLDDSMGLFDEFRHLMGFDPSLPCINERSPRQHLANKELAPVHDADLPRVVEAQEEAYSGSSTVVDFRIEKGNTNIIKTCTFMPIEMDTALAPFVVSEMHDGYAQRNTP